jgi:hypothetical protein
MKKPRANGVGPASGRGFPVAVKVRERDCGSLRSFPTRAPIRPARGLSFIGGISPRKEEPRLKHLSGAEWVLSIFLGLQACENERLLAQVTVYHTLTPYGSMDRPKSDQPST